ncbi:MAG: lactate dehydrogenase [Planctomycetota bacterium]
MKVAIIGVGAVGTSCAKAMLLRGTAEELVLVDKVEARAQGVEADLSHGALLCPATRIRQGSYQDIGGAAVVVITAGKNEQAGGAIDRNDSQGRLRLLPENAKVYEDVVPKVSRAAPDAVILVVTDPPDPLADVARQLAGKRNKVLSTGTFLDSLRFRLQIARRLGCHPASVEALVVGEHGTTQVYLWSSARVGGESVLRCAARRQLGPARFRANVEKAVKHANIDIIEGTGASQHGIGIVTARLCEAILRDEGLVAPVGVYQPGFGVTLSMPSVIGRRGVTLVLQPGLAEDEAAALAVSARAISAALGRIGYPRRSGAGSKGQEASMMGPVPARTRPRRAH